MANFARLSTVQYQDLCDDRGTLIRLWLSARSAHRTSPQKIGCINVVPRIKITNREHINGEEITQIHNINCEEELPSEKWSLENSRPEYECLDEMLERLNELLENKPIMGKILSVETVPIPVDGWSVDTETSYWSDQSQQSNNIVYILRVYFEYGSCSRERIEVIDFVPQVHVWDTPLAVPIYETFSSLLTRSSQWLKEQPPGLRFLSCNVVEVPIEEAFNIDRKNSSNVIDSRKMFYPKSGQTMANETKEKSLDNQDKCLLRFLRLSVARPQATAAEAHFPPNVNNVKLNCKIFVPNKTSMNTIGEETEFETVNQSKRKIEAWLMTTGARILSAETTVVSIPFSSSSIATSIDSCLKSDSKGMPGYYLTAYRIYIDGFYLEPPAKLLPMTIADRDDEAGGQSSSCLLM